MNHTEYLAMIKEVNRLRTNVHLFNEEELSESALDDLKHKIAEYESLNPDKIETSSPTQTVAGGVLAGFVKYPHSRRVLSLQDVFSQEELQDWEKRWKDRLYTLRSQPDIQGLSTPLPDVNEKDPVTQQKSDFASGITVSYTAEPKLDGMAIVLHYQQGKLVRAVTRGDSRVGEDVTQSIQYVRGIPATVPTLDTLEIRGELLMKKSDFLKLNKQIAEGKKIGKLGKTGIEAVFANPRNAVAGTIRNLDTSILQERNIFFIAYGLFQDPSISK